MQRMGRVIKVRAEHLPEYKRLHADVWPRIIELLSSVGIKNYSIYLKEPENILFSYWEYHGSDFAADDAKVGADPEMKRWWALTDPMQEPFADRRPGDWWATMDEVFHMD